MSYVQTTFKIQGIDVPCSGLYRSNTSIVRYQLSIRSLNYNGPAKVIVRNGINGIPILTTNVTLVGNTASVMGNVTVGPTSRQLVGEVYINEIMVGICYVSLIRKY